MSNQVTKLAKLLLPKVDRVANKVANNDKEDICDVCGEKCDTHIGMRVRLNDVNDPDIIRLKETFGKLNFGVCLCCWILSLGVKPKITELEKRNEAAFSEWKRYEAEWLKNK